MKFSVALLCAVLIAGCASVPHLGDSEAAIAAEDVAAGHRASRLKTLTPKPEFREIRYTIDGRDYAASLYLPGEPAAGAIVFIPGLHKGGRHQAQVQNLGRTLARLRFVVLVPEIEAMRRLEVSPGNIADIVNAVRYLRDNRDLDTGGRIGIIGVSYGAGLAVLAAAAPSVSSSVRFVITLGGYYDFRNVVRYLTTGTVVDGRGGASITPDVAPEPTSRWYFAISNLSVLQSARDQAVLRRYLYAKFRPTVLSQWLHKPPDNLSADAAALMDVTENADPGRFDDLLARLPEPIKTRMRLLDPSQSDLSCLSAEVILIHGVKDRVIPIEESRTFASRVERSRLFVLEAFEHTRFEFTSAVAQLLPMLEYVLELRDRLGDMAPEQHCGG